MKFLHIVLPSKRMMDTYFRMIRKNFDIEEHRFVFWDQCVGDDRVLFKYGNVGEVTGKNRFERICSIYQELNKADVIIWHGLIFGTKRVLFLYLIRKFLKKSVWIMRGIDLYNWRKEKRTLKNQLLNIVNFKCRKKIPYVVSIFPTDEKVYRSQFGDKNKVFFTPYPFTEDAFIAMDKLENIKERINGKKYIQVAHNAFTFNHHLEILESLEHFRKENIKIIVPLSYGNDWTNVEDGYVDKVIEKAEDIFDSKAECLVRMMPSDKYTNLLCNIDIGIYGATRQNGLGNILRLLYMGNKVYLNSDGPVYGYFKSQGISVFDTKSIPNLSYEEFIKPVKNVEKAKAWIREYHHPDCVALKWRDLFEDLREQFGEKRQYPRSTQEEVNERIWSGYSSGIQAECYKENYICLDRYLRQKKGTILKNIKDVIIVGTDNLAKEVYQWLKDENKIQKKWFIQGFIDDNKVSFNDEINDCDIIDSMEYFNDENLDVFVILAIEKIEDIKKYSKQLTEKNVTCCSYAHPLSQFGKNIKLGVGCLCGPNSHVANSVVLGDYVHIFSSTIERGCAIGDYTLIDSDSWIGANVIIGKNVIVGAKTTIMPNIRVADYSIISPGSIIVKDILGATNDEE